MRLTPSKTPARLLAAATLSLVLGSSLAGCGEGETAQPPSSTTAQDSDDPASADATTDTDDSLDTDTDSADATEGSEPLSMADEAAQAALAEVCDRLDPAEIAALLEMKASQIERVDEVSTSQFDGDYASCMFSDPSVTDEQRFVAISVQGDASDFSRSVGEVTLADGSLGYYDEPDKPTLLYVTPPGSAYVYGIFVLMPYETSVSGMDAETVARFQEKAAEVAAMLLA